MSRRVPSRSLSIVIFYVSSVDIEYGKTFDLLLVTVCTCYSPPNGRFFSINI
jgi:hypothetical protein